MHDIRSSILHGVKRETLSTKSAVPGRKPKGGGLTGISIRREEARQSNQRSEDRHLQIVDRAVLRVHRSKHDVQVINVSSHGVMISADIAPRIGAKAMIRFEGCNETQCAVRWVKDGRVGLEFATETLIIAAADVRQRIISGRRAGEEQPFALKKERPPRHHFLIKGQLHSPIGSMPVSIRNISTNGAMLEGTEDLTPGTEIVLEIFGAPAAPGQVVWCRSSQIGVRFDAEFDLPRLAPQALEAPPAMLKPEYLKSDGDPNSPWAGCWDRLSPDDL